MRRSNTHRMSTVSGWMTMCSLIVIASLVGCGGAPKAAHSGFLDDYSKLKPAERFDGAYFWESPKFKDYHTFMVDPIVVHFAPGAEGVAIDPGNLKQLTDRATQKLMEVIAKRNKLVDQPGPGVAELRTAITSIKTTTAVANIHPGTRLSGVGLGGAAFESKAVDSVTGELLAAIYDSKPGSRIGLTEGYRTLGHAEQVIDRWVALFGDYLDQLAEARAKREGK